MAQIYDNIDDNTFEQGFKRILTSPNMQRLDCCVGYFNLRGWGLIEDQVDALSGATVWEGDTEYTRHCRLLIGMHRPEEEYIRMLYGTHGTLPDAKMVQECKRKIARDFKKQLTIGLPSRQDEVTLRRLSRQLRDRRVVVKLYLCEPLHAKLYVAYKDDYTCPRVCVMGSSNLTYAGLTKQGELNAEFADKDDTAKFANWFEDRWNDCFCIDISEELINAIDHSWAAEREILPYYIYLKVAYHLSEEARKGLKELTITHEFRKELLDFQQNAVKIATRHLNNEKRGGAMIGDVVGLGKTITACAIAKIYEENYSSSTLIVCPASLQTMWQHYIDKYDLKADVLSMSKAIDPDHSRHYRLVIIDESHNLRNGGKRYQNIRALIERQDCKVLLLTATPYNKEYKDLSTQLRLFLREDQDLGIRPEEYIRSLGGVRAFAERHPDIFVRSIKAFEQSTYIEDWNELMKLFLVRRTRSFIKKYYAKEAPDGRRYLEIAGQPHSYFPERLPKSIKFPTDPGDQYSRLYSEQMIELMNKLQLPRYGLSQYIKPDKRDEASEADRLIIENLSKAGQRMMGFCRSTFFKRIDSSGFSFLLTLYRHLLRNYLYIYALDNKLPLPIGDDNALPEEYSEDVDKDDALLGEAPDTPPVTGATLAIPTDVATYMQRAQEHYDTIRERGNVTWLSSEYFKQTLKRQIKRDSQLIIQMIKLCGAWQQETDQKLNELHRLLISSEHQDDKVIVFTQYSDTAHYIYNQLCKRGMTHVGVATGDSENPSAIATCFSPISNDKADQPIEQQTRVLIATDVLSEGHNLQDAHVVVNYDLPWAIIRLIQRAGRVDRIGQTADKIYCYSFFPAEGVEEIIRLRERLNSRINQNADIVGSDEQFFEGNEQNLRDMYNERSGILDGEDDEETDVDLTSQAYEIWKAAIEADPTLEQTIPNLENFLYSTKSSEGDHTEGVITYARTASDYDILTYLDQEGQVITQSQKRILEALRCKADTPSVEPLELHHQLVQQTVQMLDEQDSGAATSGTLGGRFSTRYRIYMLLSDYIQQHTYDHFYTKEVEDQIKIAIDQVYNYPLREQTKLTLGRMLRSDRLSADDIVKEILDMSREGIFCRIDEESAQHRENTIICSLGIRDNH